MIAEYASTLQPPKPNVPPVQSAFRFSRSADGRTRVDSGNMSTISNPTTGQTVVLDHLKKTALVHQAPPPLPQPPALPHLPQVALPGMPQLPQPPTAQVQDLGKSAMHGHEVEGKRYLIQPPPPPKPPTPPPLPAAPPMPALKMPAMPQVPKLPAEKIPQIPPPPKPPAPPTPPPPPSPTAAEVWTSTKLQVPMHTKLGGSFGQLTQVCQRLTPGEPHPAAFQIPPDYRVIAPPPPPQPPALPQLKPPVPPPLKPPEPPKF